MGAVLVVLVALTRGEVFGTQSFKRGLNGILDAAVECFAAGLWISTVVDTGLGGVVTPADFLVGEGWAATGPLVRTMGTVALLTIVGRGHVATFTVLGRRGHVATFTVLGRGRLVTTFTVLGRRGTITFTVAIFGGRGTHPLVDVDVGWLATFELPVARLRITSVVEACFKCLDASIVFLVECSGPFLCGFDFGRTYTEVALAVAAAG